MAKWEKIETAPKDCRRILGCNANSKIMMVTWRSDVGSEDYRIPHTETTWKPTHWMKLPDPPKKNL